MSLGKPVIVTNYSSSTEFCNKENSIPIPFQMQKPRDEDLDCGPFHNVELWPEPDINAAAHALRQLYEDPEFAVRLGDAAKSFISEHFSLENFRKSVEDFLKA